MKNKFRNLIAGAALGLATVLVTAASFNVPTQLPPVKPAITNSAAVTFTSTGITFAGPTNQWVNLTPGKPLTFFSDVTCGAAGTSNVIWTIEFSADGTNALTSPTLNSTNVSNGTNTTRYATTWTVNEVNNFSKARVKTLASPTLTTNTARAGFLQL